MMSHTGEKPHQCSECDKKIVQKNDFDRHFVTYTGEKPYPCSLCDKSFALNRDLERQFLIHTKEKPYTCNQCVKSFTRKYDLGIHSDKVFSVYSEFQKHMLTPTEQTHLKAHTGEKPYQSF